jgi:predicted P-loop ATPase
VEGENSEKKKNSYVEDIEDALKERYDFRVNAIKGMPEYKRKSEETWQSINDYVLNSLVRDLQSNYIKRASKDMISTLLNSSFAPQVDPIIEYFKSLKWDENDHIETLCRTVDPVGEDGEASRKMFKKYLTKWLVAAIANVIDKKVCRNHQCFILAGPQGAGKSTWIKKLCPPELEPYYVEQGLDPDNKDSQLDTTTNFIFNLDDYFAATTSKKINEFKGMITKNVVKVRMPYGRYPEERAKICSFVASSNEAQFLHDPTGNRRFVPFEVSDIHLDKLPGVDINQVWAQAYHLYNSGFQYWLNKEDQNELNKHNSQFEVRSAEYEYLDYYFKIPEEGDEIEHFDTGRLTNKLNEFTNLTLSVKKVGEAARKIGFKRQSFRVGKKSKKDTQ